MIGITSFGGYIPRLRLDRMAIYKGMGWFAPAIIAVAQGERSFCNWDEDSLTMAVASSRDCLIGRDRSQIDGVYLGSTTLPFADRLNAGILKTALCLSDHINAADFTSCLRAGTTALASALSAVKSGDKKQVLVTATDKRLTKPAYFYEMWFGDGAASLLVGSENVIAEYLGSFTVTRDFVDHYRGSGKTYDYMWEERWVRDLGYSTIIPEAVNGLFDKLSISMDDVDKLVFPCFFKAEHKKIAKELGAGPDKLVDNMHDVCGETGAAHPLVMFVKTLQEAKPGDRILLAGFGQGADALYFRVTDAIQDLAPRQGITGSLAKKKPTDNYFKFLKFRELIDPEMGIRAEAPTQTAMTVLYRKRDLLTGLTGGKCRACGTPQIPRQRICVNPDCGAVDSQDPYEFADIPATVKTFTADLLAVSVDPPHIYGMVQFEGGGRFMADFTDCELEDVKVGGPVRLSFRKRYDDKGRGFSGYFWKAIPLPVKKAVVKDEIRFDGQVVVVTGAGAGLGRVYALDFAKRGAKVVVNDLGGARDGTGASVSAADQVVQEIKELGGEAVANYDSVATADGGQNIIQTAIDTYGRVDVVINNAGILRDKTLIKMDPENWSAVLDVHLKGAYNVSRPAFVKMREQGYGRIILTTSAAGLYGNFGQTNYSSAKMGLVGFMNTMKSEGDKYNIKVNTVAPVAATRLTEDILPPDMMEKLKPEFVSPLVLYLGSNRCTDTGMIFNAGMGYYNRAAIVTGSGAVVGDGRTPPTLEQVHAHFESFDHLDDADEYPNATAAFTPMLDAFSPKKAKKEASKSGSGPTVKSIMQGLSGAFQADKAAGVDVIFGFSVSGPDGGEWSLTIKDRQCHMAEGKPDAPSCTLSIGDQDFVKMMTGQMSPMSAFTSGKLKIGGDIMKSQLIEKLFTL